MKIRTLRNTYVEITQKDCTKRKFKNKKEAIARMKEIAEQCLKDNVVHYPRRAYLCNKCNFIHITKMKEETAISVEKIRLNKKGKLNHRKEREFWTRKLKIKEQDEPINIKVRIRKP